MRLGALFTCLAACPLECCAVHLWSGAGARAAGEANASVAVATAQAQGKDASVFMLTAGITAPEEMCLLAMGGAVYLDACALAVAAGDGRELWSFQAAGQLLHMASSKCADIAADQSSGALIEMRDCSGASMWKMLPNAQVQVGGFCLSQMGTAVGSENAAFWAAVHATSSANTLSHGAEAAVDADEASYWASRFDEANPVTFTIDLGETRIADAVRIKWEYPPLAFSVQISADGQRWAEVFETDSNMVNVTRISVGKAPTRELRLIMTRAHPLFGRFSGKLVYGIRAISVLAPRLRAVAQECAVASRSADARDKYFAVHVQEFDPAPAAALRAELPALGLARASLSASLSRVAMAIPALPSCAAQVALLSDRRAAGVSSSSERRKASLWRNTSMMQVSSAALPDQRPMPSRGVAALVERAHEVDEAGVKLLLASARTTVLAMREVLR